VANLVAVDLPGGPDFVDAVRRSWERGDAVLPLDRRLPASARDELLRALRPTHVYDAQGLTPLTGGRPVEHGDALMMATSGTTGAPKGVVLTIDALHAAATAAHTRLAVSAGDTWLACLPLNHIGGFGVIARAILDSTGLVVHDGFDAAAVAQAARDGVTAVALVPTTLSRIDPAAFRVVLLGGARPPADRPHHVVATYGMTESAGGVVYDGRPLDGVEIAIDHDGQILLRGPMTMRGYRQPDGTVIDPRVDGWLATGDIGGWHPDGRLHIEGRRGELIISGGENIWPEAVERHLSEHPLVREVAVLGLPDAEWGQRVTALVVADGTPPSLASLRGFLADRLPAFMAPKELHVVDSIPRTSVGKIARVALPELIQPSH
jgi:o-succinylbenzoate---CoA ligase